MLRRSYEQNKDKGSLVKSGGQRWEDLRTWGRGELWGGQWCPSLEDGTCHVLTWVLGPGENHVPVSAEQASWSDCRQQKGSVVEKQW